MRIKQIKPGPNTSAMKTVIKRGLGKSQATSPSHSHKLVGAVMTPRPAKGPMDNRGKDNDRIRMQHRSWPR